MKYRIRNLLTGELAPITDYYLSGDGLVRDCYRNNHVYLKAEMCTGVQDVNGVDIYEGDVVHICEKGHKWTVRYGAFGDAKFYVCNNINSCRELENEYDCGAHFSITNNSIDCEIII